MKKRDILLAGGIVLVALVMLLAMHVTGETKGDQVQITVNGEIYGTYPLEKDQMIEVTEGEFHNVIRIEDGQAYMEEADCPDGYCKEQGRISGQKQTIVCLPHKLVVEVIRQKDTDSKAADDDLVPDTPKGNEKMKKQEQQKNGCRERSLASISRRVSSGAMLVALAMIFSYVESLIPINLGVPGIKLGVANLVTVTGLYILAPMEVLLVVILRVLLVGFMFGNGMSILYSLAGGILSFLVMLLLKRIKGFSMIGVSIAGGVSHNIGQIAVAMCVLENTKLVYYLPVLMIAGTITGILIGVVSQKILPAVSQGAGAERKNG